MEKYGPTRGRFLPTHVEPFFHVQILSVTVEPTCLGTAFVVCHVCHAVVQCGFVRLGGVWACVWNVVFARYFSGVAMAFEWYFWCMGGLLLVGVLVVVAWLVVSSHNMSQ